MNDAIGDSFLHLSTKHFDGLLIPEPAVEMERISCDNLALVKLSEMSTPSMECTDSNGAFHPGVAMKSELDLLVVALDQLSGLASSTRTIPRNHD